jgi:quercetin dioxygenase-like cupin family protein
LSKLSKCPVILAGILLGSLGLAWAQGPSIKPVPKTIPIGSGEQEYVRLLGGPPDSLALRSGAVTLQPGKTVGKHNTEMYEELIIVLEGRGAMVLSDGRQLDIGVGAALYCPPHTEHDVKNTGSGPLRYIYVVAKTE